MRGGLVRINVTSRGENDHEISIGYSCAAACSALSAQDGAAIYKERCAACHDAPEGRVPALSAIKAMSGEAIYVALTSGIMKSRAEGLSTPQIFALLGYIAPTGGAQTTPVKFTAHAKGTRPFNPTADARSGTAGAPA